MNGMSIHCSERTREQVSATDEAVVHVLGYFRTSELLCRTRVAVRQLGSRSEGTYHWASAIVSRSAQPRGPLVSYIPCSQLHSTFHTHTRIRQPIFDASKCACRSRCLEAVWRQGGERSQHTCSIRIQHACSIRIQNVYVARCVPANIVQWMKFLAFHPLHAYKAEILAGTVQQPGNRRTN